MIIRHLHSAWITFGVLLAMSAVACADEPRQHALLIGIENYDPDQFVSVPAAGNDATKLADLLRRAGFNADDVVVMTNKTGADDPRRLPTLTNIREQLRSLAKQVNARDSLIVAFNGHGLQGVNNSYMLCPFDADLEDVDSLISINEVFDALQTCPAKHKLLLIDGMHDQPFAKDIDTAIASELTQLMPVLPEIPNNTAVFLSCGIGEATTYPTAHQGSKFFASIIKGIQGEAAGSDGSVTLPDVERYVKKRFETASSRPVLFNNTAGLFTIVTHSLGEDDMEKIQRLIRGDRYEEASMIVEARLATHPDDATALAQRSRLISYHAEQFRDYSRMHEALQAAEKAIQLAPHEPLPYIARSNVFRIERKYEKAFADGSAAVQRDPNCVMAHVICAFAMHHLHDLDGMRRAAKTAMEIDPEHPEARAIYVAYLFATGQIDDGHTELDRAIAITPDMPALYFLKGYGYEKQGKHREAVQQYSNAIKLNDRIPDYLCRRALSLANDGNHKAAMADIAAAERVAPGFVEIASARTMVMQKQHGYGHAEATIAEGLKANPKSADLWQGRGFNHLNRGQYEQAVQAFNQVLEINPSYGEAHMGIGMARFKQHRLDDALVHLNRATRHKEHLARAYYEKSEVYTAKRDYNKALAELEKGIQYDPSNRAFQIQRRNLIARGAKSNTNSAAASKTTATVPSKPARTLPAESAKQKASVNGKYSHLLFRLTVQSDVKEYGEFHDYGHWDESVYAGHRNLPTGYWVYVYPNWYIWKNAGQPRPTKRTHSYTRAVTK